MEYLQQQVWELSEQVRNLSKIIESLPQQLLKGMRHSSASLDDYSTNYLDRDAHATNYATNYLEHLEHKDILVDNHHSQWHDRLEEKDISQEWQVRRLTAQLTIAYNRIAELEEELLNRRIASR